MPFVSEKNARSSPGAGVLLSLLLLVLPSMASSKEDPSSRLWLVERNFPKPVMIQPQSPAAGAGPQAVLDAALMSAASLQELRQLPGVARLASFDESSWMLKGKKLQPVTLWSVGDGALDILGASPSPACARLGSGDFLLGAPGLLALGLQAQQQLQLQGPVYAPLQLSGTLQACDTPVLQALPHGHVVILASAAKALQAVQGLGFGNPRVLLQFSAKANAEQVRARVADFLAQRAQPSVTGSVLVLKPLAQHRLSVD